MKEQKPIHLKGLNGIRALVALSVVIAHITNHLSQFGLYYSIFGNREDGTPKSWALAQYGVTIFFVLSGFLITYLLLKEKKKTPINIKSFYLRRILRIWPLYFTYLILVVITYYLFEVEYNKNTLLYYVFIGGNLPLVFNNSIPLLGHYWSLGSEEQFYLYWPWITKRSKNILKSAIIITLLIVSLKTVLHVLNPNSLLEYYIHYSRFDCMIIGAIAGILFNQKNSLFILMTTHTVSQLIAWGALIVVSLNKFHLISFLDQEIISIAAVVVIMGQVTQTSFINLDKKVLNFLGKISFGIYVIHPLVIFYFVKTINADYFSSPLNYLIIYLGIIITTIVFAHISYLYLELPFLKIKKNKYTVIKSSSIET